MWLKENKSNSDEILKLRSQCTKLEEENAFLRIACPQGEVIKNATQRIDELIKENKRVEGINSNLQKKLKGEQELRKELLRVNAQLTADFLRLEQISTDNPID